MTHTQEDLLIHTHIDRMAFAGSRNAIIRNMNLSLYAGTVVSILGPSGLGKTTLLRIIAGLEGRFEGTRKAKRSLRIQMVFQDSRLFPWMTVRENVKSSNRETRRRSGYREVDDIIHSMGLDHVRDAWPATLSGGESARVALARAVLSNPDVLLLDEPFGDLDIRTRLEMVKLIDRVLCRNPRQLIVIVTHSPEDAVLLSDRILYFDGCPMMNPLEIQVSFPRPRRPDSAEVLLEVVRIASIITSNVPSGVKLAE